MRQACPCVTQKKEKEKPPVERKLKSGQSRQTMKGGLSTQGFNFAWHLHSSEPNPPKDIKPPFCYEMLRQRSHYPSFDVQQPFLYLQSHFLVPMVIQKISNRKCQKQIVHSFEISLIIVRCYNYYISFNWYQDFPKASLYVFFSVRHSFLLNLELSLGSCLYSPTFRLLSPDFIWTLGIRAQALMLPQTALYELSQLPSTTITVFLYELSLTFYHN